MTGLPAPLSFEQRRLWFLHQLYPDSPAYNVWTAHRLRGPLDPTCLHRAFSELVRRHQVLRSTMDTDASGQPVQRVAAPGAFELPVTRLRDGSGQGRLDRVAMLAREHVLRPFDLRRGPLFRAELFELDADDHVLLTCLHHVVADHWSLSVLLRELSELYGAYLIDRPPPLAEPSIQYADFAGWQRERLGADVLDRQERHWRERLSGFERLELHTDHPRSTAQRWTGARVRHRVPAAVVAELRRLAARHDATLFMVVAAALTALLARYTGQSDIAFGAALANRGRPELEELIGFFVNTVVLRTDLSDDPSFAELLTRVRERALEAGENGDLPFDRVTDISGSDRDLSRPALVSVVLSFLNTPARRWRIPGTAATEFEFDPGIVKFELDVYAIEADGGLNMDIDYRRDLFDRAGIERMLDHLERLLAGVAADSTRPVSTVDLIAPDVGARLLAWGNASGPLTAPAGSVPELFARQVAARPDEPALRDGDQMLTYRELAAMAGQLARRLRTHRGESPICVGVCLDRTVESVVTLVAVLAAGGYYLPLDPGYPAERLRFMLADSGADVLVTTRSLAAKVPGWSGPTLLVDGESTTVDARDAGATGPDLVASPEDLAYVMYTSGSTGRPKGIRVPHRAVVRLVYETDYVRIGPGDRVAHASSISFDAATFEIWGALLTGAELVIVRREVVVEPRRLAERLRALGITVLWMTSSLFNHTVRAVPDAVAGIGTVIVGGEALDAHTIRAVLRDGPPGRLINGYGPTENTTFSTTHLITAVPEDAVSVPIGRPISGTRCYAMDDALRLVPVGVPGELCVAGAGLAQGYVGDPVLTAQRFVPDPYGAPGELLYRTGDIVRWHDDGVLEFLGRRDDQLKIRGYRIEPGEIEAALRVRPGVRAVVVVARPGDSGPSLVAYLVPDGTTDLSTSDIQRVLAESMPAHLVPSGFVVLDRLPLTANGKVDRARLPEPMAATTSADFVAPRNDLETTVSREWGRLLRVDRVGVTDNFFHLGGDSLLATRAVSALRRDLGVRLTVRTLFDHPTVEAFASALQRIREPRG
jgi:amino acid adenylation domain-containing protein